MSRALSLILPAFLFASSTSFADENQLKEELQKLQIQVQSLETRQKSGDGSQAHSDTSVGGYGEINNDNYSKDQSRDTMDLRRFVIFLGHRFDENLSFAGEVEWEHAVTSKDDDGETEIEQAFLNYQFHSRLGLKAGLFLMPFGFLNESHEPPVFYGVERNEVETRIIPSTWREGGLALYGTTESDLDWNVGVVTGFDIAKFSDAGNPLASVHQELQMAKSQDFGAYGALNYRIPGFTAGTAVFSGNSTQGNADHELAGDTPDFSGIRARVTLADLHTRWQEAGWDIEGLYAKGAVADTDKINAALATYNAGNPAKARAFVPEEFYGWLVQVAHRFSTGSTAVTAPFIRYEEYDTQSKMSAGLTADPANKDHVTTVGLSFFPHPQAVFKADYQWYSMNQDNNRFDLGMGYMF